MTNEKTRVTNLTTFPEIGNFWGPLIWQYTHSWGRIQDWQHITMVAAIFRMHGDIAGWPVQGLQSDYHI